MTDVEDQTLLVARAWANSFRAFKSDSGNRLSPSSDVVVRKIAAELDLPHGTIRVAMQRYADAIQRSHSCRQPDQNRPRATVNGNIVQFHLDENP
jgi:hypothetical protein